MQSVLDHLIDVKTVYIITPKAASVEAALAGKFGNTDRVKYIDEAIFPFTFTNVTDVMYNTVKERGNYALDDNSPFEKTIWGRTGWFLQQVLKMYAGRVLNLNDYILLDSDLVGEWR